MFKRALAIREKALGKEHPDVATSIDSLGVLYDHTSRYAEAEPLLKRALAIREKALGKEHPDVATSLNDLAVLYYHTWRYAEAEPLYKEALAIREKAFGKEHPDVAQSLDNLAVLYDNTSRYAEEEPLLKRALAIREKALGKEHPDVATNLNNLAVLYVNTSRYAEAEPLYKRALAIREKSLGKEHPDVALSLHNLAMLYSVTQRHPEAHLLFTRSLVINDKTREGTFSLLSEDQKLKYMKTNEYNMHLFLNHTVSYLQTDNTAVTDVLNSWLRWKGAVAEAQGRYMDALSYSDNPEIKRKFDELTATRRGLAMLQMSGPKRISPEQYIKSIADLEKRKKELEAELSRLSSDFALATTAARVDVKKISGMLPKDSAYIDFAYIISYDFTKQKWGKPRYVVFILKPDKEPVVQLLDIADAGEVDAHIKAYRQEMNRPATHDDLPRNAKLDKEAKALYELIIKPLEPYLDKRQRLFISPDGNLNLIPFEVLRTPDGKYLMEEYRINYIAAGRDIVRFTDTTTSKGDALIMADPDYDMGLKEKNKIAKELKVTNSVRGVISRDVKGLTFSRLPDTKIEADTIAKALKNRFRTYMGRKAIEEVLFSAKSPRILHIATHGYFLKNEETKPSGNGVSISQDRFSDLKIEDPMLRSGIVLAGVNAALKQGRDDGMVSAEKILGLRLKGTELVVLSACETGVGDVQAGEGVLGLKRAFILSGAKTIVMSLWSVPSSETTELMTDFYKLMSSGLTKSDALRQAKIKMMERTGNPFFWGAFIMDGNPE